MSMCLAMLVLLAVIAVTGYIYFQKHCMLRGKSSSNNGTDEICKKFAKKYPDNVGDTIATIVTGQTENSGKFFKSRDAESGELLDEISGDEVERLLVTNPEASIFYQQGNRVAVGKGRCWTREVVTINSDVDVKPVEPKKKPKPRVRKPRKNKKTQGKS